ncbi:hypothetical protein [Papillibacter cinnamivorans]|uniref:Uncharacterized protein n=1 Tax=Papillibacter cinnamivorans DSM 12816 TaxID=1122930 RepID=A0A1W1YPG3_9FIRM|nr:hypothetical protein [Papillibacter cinnamivorans]SMC38085.1 hypothetical protein SAMN02745168_0594 [Papillibacter cinnamivorans DSM 12816]
MDKKSWKLLKKFYKTDFLTFENSTDEFRYLCENGFLARIYSGKFDSYNAPIPTDNYRININGKAAFEMERDRRFNNVLTIVLAVGGVITAISTAVALFK